jgi:hypothetical protein
MNIHEQHSHHRFLKNHNTHTAYVVQIWKNASSLAASI